jgi:membrane protein
MKRPAAPHRPALPPRAGWWEIARRIWREASEDNLSMIAAGAAFFGLLAVFPALAACVSVYGLLTDPSSVSAHTATLAGFVPSAARSVIDAQLERVTAASNGALGLGTVAALAFALWSSAKGVKSLMVALNVVYDEPETRGIVAVNATALLLTLAMIVVVPVALASVALLPVLLDKLALPPTLATAARWLRWPLLGAIALGVIALHYRYAAARRAPQWRSLLRGAAAAAVLWLLGSAAFSWYVTNFGTYNETYGSVAAMAVLMMWFWLSAFAVLLGAELSAELESQSRVREPRPSTRSQNVRRLRRG